jgi:hypothetical protein
MNGEPRLSLGMSGYSTQYAPLVVIGCFVRERGLLAPIFDNVRCARPSHVKCPEGVLVDLWVSMLAGCRSVSQINTMIRPDQVLARAWGRACFHEQSTVARVLDAYRAEETEQLRSGVNAIYREIGQAPHHDWSVSPLMVDIDLTGLPAGRQAEGSTKGYFSGKRGRADGRPAGWVRPTMVKASRRSCIRATP